MRSGLPSKRRVFFDVPRAGSIVAGAELRFLLGDGRVGSGLPVCGQPPRRSKDTRKQQVEEHRWNAVGLYPISSGG
jgi:hypothetical protein